MPVRQEYEIGHMFGHLKLLKEIEPILVGSRYSRMMLLQCKCGNIVEKQLKCIRQSTKCCGCTHKNPGFPPTAKVGDRFSTNEGYQVEIISYIKHSNVVVQFLDGNGGKVKTNIQAVRNGSVANPYHKSVYGVGCYGEPSDTWKECKPLYNTWAGMIERVHIEDALNKRPTYRECSIVDEWYNFANFYEWAKEEVGSKNKGWQLDKDILYKGNKIYGPNTCCFVPSQLNALFTKREAERGKYPIGVMEYKTRQGKIRLRAEVCDPDKNKRISGSGGKSEEECFMWYKTHKEDIIKRQADKYKNSISQKVYEALYRYTVEITD